MADDNVTLTNAGNPGVDDPDAVYSEINQEIRRLKRSLQDLADQESLEKALRGETTQTFGSALVVAFDDDFDLIPAGVLAEDARKKEQAIQESIDFMDTQDSEDPPTGKDILQVPGASRESEYLPMFFDMVDRDLTRKDILLGTDLLVSTIKMNPNPESMQVNSQKKINRYMTMTRFVEEHWGDEIDTVSLSGSTYSFFGFYGKNSADNRGLSNIDRSNTAAYEYLRQLIRFYQMNGCVYQGSGDYESDTELTSGYLHDFERKFPESKDNHPRKGMIKERLYVRMNYDYLTLLGRFESFDIVEDQSMPYRMQYNAIFKAEKTIFNLDYPRSVDATVPVSGTDSLLALNTLGIQDNPGATS